MWWSPSTTFVFAGKYSENKETKKHLYFETSYKQTIRSKENENPDYTLQWLGRKWLWTGNSVTCTVWRIIEQ